MGNGGMGNGEWGTGNGEWGTGNGEWGTGNGERGMGNGEREWGDWDSKLLVRPRFHKIVAFISSAFANGRDDARSPKDDGSPCLARRSQGGTRFVASACARFHLIIGASDQPGNRLSESSE